MSTIPTLSPERRAELADSATRSFWWQAITAVLIFNAFFARDLYHFSVEWFYAYGSLGPIYAILCFIISRPIVSCHIANIPFATEFRVKAALFIAVLLIPHIVR